MADSNILIHALKPTSTSNISEPKSISLISLTIDDDIYTDKTGNVCHQYVRGQPDGRLGLPVKRRLEIKYMTLDWFLSRTL